MDDSVTRLAIIAEDEPLGRTLLAEAAQAAGLIPALFDNGTAALAAALAQKPAIALLDVEMPGLNGYEVCRRIRAVADLDTVPVVMVTGRDDMEAVNYAFEAGATDFISKPVNWSLLPHRLAYVLRNAAAVRKLADREAKVTTLIAAIPDALWVVSPTGLLRWSPNKRRSAALDEALPDATGGLESIVPSEHVISVGAAIRDTARDGQARKIEYRDKRPQANQASSELRFSRCQDGDVLVVLQDTSARTAAADHIERLAYFDPLTGLANRQRCIERAAQLLELAEAAGSGVSFIYMDLNNFKRINESFGHSVGDAVLKAISEVLARTVRPFDAGGRELLLSRLSADEFAILVGDRSACTQALAIANACCTALEDPVSCGSMEFYATPSIGISTYPQDGRDVETLLKHADTARYHAKVSGAPNVTLYAQSMSARIRDWLDLEMRLRRA
ncbi:MAG: diguanylate cyclase, partial [Gammaproteobacteria bacterium]|nr:diguanylate cyclase [Gammaproteobacteria bacterium]